MWLLDPVFAYMTNPLIAFDQLRNPALERGKRHSRECGNKTDLVQLGGAGFFNSSFL